MQHISQLGAFRMGRVLLCVFPAARRNSFNTLRRLAALLRQF